MSSSKARAKEGESYHYYYYYYYIIIIIIIIINFGHLALADELIEGAQLLLKRHRVRPVQRRLVRRCRGAIGYIVNIIIIIIIIIITVVVIIVIVVVIAIHEFCCDALKTDKHNKTKS